MKAILIDGKKAADVVYERVKAKSTSLARRGLVPGLATVLVGEDPASATYVRQKIKSCQAYGLRSVHVPLPALVTEKELLEKIDSLNADPSVHGILVQLPLPKHLCTWTVLQRIDPAKDADGLHPYNQGKWFQLKSWEEIQKSGCPLPCTPYGIIEMMEQNKISAAGKHAVVLGRSALVGKPISVLLLSQNATVTQCHSQSQNLPALTQTADILVAAIGQPRLVKSFMVKKGAVVIDVGIHREQEGMCGDVDFADVSKTASAITPVPGGVGRMTVAMLLMNTVTLAEKSATGRN
ncbi:MAG TPA: bifunctional 5,10-methylenetetrahydrofolate dehydrogenase/5,10-methenyltetrahydrofolate cyclohydrolase [Elusimicrobiota bacterium]|nr:bifunctional 5,10-methylenetetrahydrofolate dehydrogenase/5,10-methenyltetrahydrofolate cyclohydrolase [Elusimicrobiota bacterium]